MTVSSRWRSPRVTNSASLAEFLFGRDKRSYGGRRRTRAFATRVGKLTGPGDLSSVAGALLRSQITTAARELLDLDLGELFLTAWRTHEALRKAARATLDKPGTEQVVDIAAHKIASKHQPYVDIVVNGVVQSRIEFDLTLELAVTGLAAVVSRGRLVRLESGRSTLTAVLCVGGKEALRRQRRLNLGVVVRLGEGVAILSPREELGHAATRESTVYQEPSRP